MKVIVGIFFKNSIPKRLFFIAFACIYMMNVRAQTCPITNPILFGLAGNYIYCRDESVGFGVLNSDDTTGQVYVFSVFRNGAETSKGGPLDGNGGQLSVAALMRSAQDAGEYRVTTYNNCGDTARTSFYPFYAGIDNLSITGWGGDSVAFQWTPSGPAPSVTYEYAVSTEADPTLLASTQTTTDTVGSAITLVSGTTYYIHVRINNVFHQGQNVDFNPFNNCNAFPWQTLRFIPCSGTAATGIILPRDAVTCTGGSATLTASGGNTYQWFTENNTPISGANGSTYQATLPGLYKVYITAAAGCEGMVASASVTQISILTGIFSGGGCFNIGDSVRLGISRTIIGQTYKILKDGIEVASLPGIGRSFESQDTVWYKFEYSSGSQAGQYTVRTDNPYCTGVDFGNQNVSGFGSWGGTVSSDWQNPLNWKCGVVPDANTNVVVEDTAPNFPVINSINATCRSLLVQPGATVTIAPGFNLDITGD